MTSGTPARFFSGQFRGIPAEWQESSLRRILRPGGKRATARPIARHQGRLGMPGAWNAPSKLSFQGALPSGFPDNPPRPLADPAQTHGWSAP